LEGAPFLRERTAAAIPKGIGEGWRRKRNYFGPGNDIEA